MAVTFSRWDATLPGRVRGPDHESVAIAVSWFQEYAGFIVVGLLVIVLPLAAKYGRRFSRRYQEKLIAENGPAKADAATKKLAGEATATSTQHRIVTFAADRDTVLGLLGAKQGPWKSDSPGVFTPGGKKINGQHATAAGLESTDGGTALVLLRAEDMSGIAMVEGNWARLRALALAAAEKAGVEASESDGPLLVRTPLGDISGLDETKLNTAPHVWLRPGQALP